MAREMTDEEKMEYDRLTANMEQMQLRLDELTAGPAVYGYADHSEELGHHVA